MPLILFASTQTEAYTALEDASLNLSAMGQTLEDLLASLNITDGTVLQDLTSFLALIAEYSVDAQTSLGAYYQRFEDLGLHLENVAELIRDVRTYLEARGEGRSDICIMAYIGGYLLQNLGLSLNTASPTILRDLQFLMSISDGAFLKDVGLVLMTVPLSKPKRADIYHRMSSVVRRVS